MFLRGIRGATVAQENSKEAIKTETMELLKAIFEANHVKAEDVGSIFFSVTQDLDAEFPAVAAREMGYKDVPLLCMNEIDVPGALAKCIRVLVHVNTEKMQKEMKHVYMKDAVKLRPDL
jgi:chorismate mutase